LLEVVAVQVAKKRWNMHEMEAKSWNMWIKSMQCECNNYLSCESLLNMPSQWGPVFSCLIVLISFRTDKNTTNFPTKASSEEERDEHCYKLPAKCAVACGSFSVSLFFFFLFSV
jgi:hypothetical protein